MNRGTCLLALPLLIAAGACNVSTDERNDQTVLSVDHDAIENGVDTAANTAESAAGEAGEAIEQAVPVIQNTAQDVGNQAERAADRVGDTIERVDVDVNVKDSNQQQQR